MQDPQQQHEGGRDRLYLESKLSHLRLQDTHFGTELLVGQLHRAQTSVSRLVCSVAGHLWWALCAAGKVSRLTAAHLRESSLWSLLMEAAHTEARRQAAQGRNCHRGAQLARQLQCHGDSLGPGL